HFRVLCRVRMLTALIDLEVVELTTAKRTARQHTFNSLLDHAFGMRTGKDMFRRTFLDTAGITGVVEKDLVARLVAGQLDLLGIDDDNVVAAIHGSRESRAMFATQDGGDSGSQAAKDHAIGVNHDPALLHVLMP